MYITLKELLMSYILQCVLDLKYDNRKIAPFIFTYIFKPLGIRLILLLPSSVTLLTEFTSTRAFVLKIAIYRFDIDEINIVNYQIAARQAVHNVIHQ